MLRAQGEDDICRPGGCSGVCGFDQPCGLQELKGGASNRMPQMGPAPQRGSSVPLRADLLISVGQTLSCRILGFQLKTKRKLVLPILSDFRLVDAATAPPAQNITVTMQHATHNSTTCCTDIACSLVQRHVLVILRHSLHSLNLHFQDLPSHLVAVPTAAGALCHY